MTCQRLLLYKLLALVTLNQVNTYVVSNVLPIINCTRASDEQVHKSIRVHSGNNFGLVYDRNHWERVVAGPDNEVLNGGISDKGGNAILQS
jgi:hypothetical protein